MDRLEHARRILEEADLERSREVGGWADWFFQVVQSLLLWLAERLGLSEAFQTLLVRGAGWLIVGSALAFVVIVLTKAWRRRQPPTPRLQRSSAAGIELRPDRSSEEWALTFQTALQAMDLRLALGALWGWLGRRLGLNGEKGRSGSGWTARSILRGHSNPELRAQLLRMELLTYGPVDLSALELSRLWRDLKRTVGDASETSATQP